MYKPHKDFLVGQTFGRLTITKRLPAPAQFGLSEAPDDIPTDMVYSYVCECACGTSGVVVREHDLFRDKGARKSCGCINKERQKRYWNQKQKSAIRERYEEGRAMLRERKK